MVKPTTAFTGLNPEQVQWVKALIQSMRQTNEAKQAKDASQPEHEEKGKGKTKPAKYYKKSKEYNKVNDAETIKEEPTNDSPGKTKENDEPKKAKQVGETRKGKKARGVKKAKQAADSEHMQNVQEDQNQAIIPVEARKLNWVRVPVPGAKQAEDADNGDETKKTVENVCVEDLAHKQASLTKWLLLRRKWTRDKESRRLSQSQPKTKSCRNCDSLFCTSENDDLACRYHPGTIKRLSWEIGAPHFHTGPDGHYHVEDLENWPHLFRWSCCSKRLDKSEGCNTRKHEAVEACVDADDLRVDASGLVLHLLDLSQDGGLVGIATLAYLTAYVNARSCSTYPGDTQ
ncbi:uncharacterized protein BCR38DRAFT_414649 [Pseudomassariella vexata]|uniref:Uncharacterized protein n=1 Tax=Pseudomassariella vexata TaxID=1141098 RepID=A0A1Y2DA34_9PEZI|nr:uncharacterized protein BCR38DRAFT_414649 [Pseudomassariella vexata]ORY56131.1 hypothetical protein BCR38DRAFT_414649 [Pseudomassariella vexata]